MDDFVVNVRQIGQYPQVTPGPGDLVLLQQGGVGGPYASSSTYDFVIGALSSAAPVVTNGIISAAGFAMPGDGAITWGVGGLLPPNLGGMLSFSVAAGWSFEYAAPGGAIALAQLFPDGNVQLAHGTLRVARDPFDPFEVATANYVSNNTVASFNGRTGPVCLTDDDVHRAFGVPEGDTLATQAWVNALLCQSIPDFINQNPFVYTWNGRVGDVFLTTADIEQAFFAQPGTYPTAPSPALGDASSKIATTQFVDDSLEDWAATINNSWNTADFELLNIMQTQFAPINSPVFTGVPQGPTGPPGISSSQLATQAFVMQAVTSSVTGVVSFNTRTGVVVFEAQDLQNVGGAFVNSPSFTGTPTTTVPPASDNSNRIATTSWVLDEIAAISAGVTSWNGRSGIVLLTLADVTTVGGAPLASPALSGTPSTPTAAPGTSTTQIASTAFVANAINNSVASWNGRTGAVAMTSADISAASGALIASPAFTGIPTAPTAPPATNTGQLATTAFVMNQLAAANVVSSFNTRTGAVTLTQADVTAVGAITDAPNDGNLYGRKSQAWAQIALPAVLQGGRLSITGTGTSSTLQYTPANGGYIRINGIDYPLPAAVNAIYNNCFINGVGGQALTMNTHYYVYMFNNAGTLTMDFSTTGHQQSTQPGNIGVEIKSGDNTRTLIGMVRPNSDTPTTPFTDTSALRFVRSWANRRPLICSVYQPSVNGGGVGAWSFFGSYWALLWDADVMSSVLTGNCSTTISFTFGLAYNDSNVIAAWGQSASNGWTIPIAVAHATAGLGDVTLQVQQGIQAPNGASISFAMQTIGTLSTNG